MAAVALPSQSDDGKMALVGTTVQRVSFEDLARWPDDGRRYELYDGEVVVVPAPAPRHQRAASHAFEVLREYARRAGITIYSIGFRLHDWSARRKLTA